MRALAAVGIGFTISIVSLASSAQAEPNPCAGRSTDSGSGGEQGPDSETTVYGTWYNCGSTPGADHVKIDVANSGDGPCITVGYESTGSSTFVRSPYYPNGPAPTFRKWKRC